jgi:hypothetical protein
VTALALVALLCFELGRSAGEPRLMADVRRSPERPTFLAGGERSEIVLKEISETLTRIDGRLEKMQALLAKDTVGKDALRQHTAPR